MKLSMVFPALLLCFYTNKITAQCIANAGPDRVICTNLYGVDTTMIGTIPSVTGGIAPYKYCWEANYSITIGSGTYFHTASQYLNDTTIATPLIISSENNPVTFILTVTDGEGNICKDTAVVSFSRVYVNLSYMTFKINKGDSIFLNQGTNVWGNFPPYKYLWKPKEGLTDSTSLSFWVKPNSPTAYYVTLTDSAGCSFEAAPYYFIGINEPQYQSVFGHTSTKWYYLPFGACDYVVSDSMFTNNTISTNNNLSHIICNSADTIGYMREDTSSGKLWFRNKQLTEEYLIMDISLTKNDIFLFYDYNNKAIPIYVDSAFILDGRKHVRFKETEINICGITEPLEFIEGIGINAGFLYQGTGQVSYLHSYLLCAYKDKIQNYSNKLFYGECKFSAVGINENQKDLFKVSAFPNPANDMINIKVDYAGNSILVYEFFSTQGQLFRRVVTESKTLQLDTSQLPKGLVFYKIADRGQIVGQGKLIIE